LELSPLLVSIFKDGAARYGKREWSSNIIRRLEDACNTSVRAPGFPAQMIDNEPETTGAEVIPNRS
jgi:3-hydroxyisobutyrate dehydrogenase